MRQIAAAQLFEIAGGLSKDDILDMSALYGCVAGTIAFMVVGGYLGCVNHVLLTFPGMLVGGGVGIPIGIAGGILYGIPLSEIYGTPD